MSGVPWFWTYFADFRIFLLRYPGQRAMMTCAGHVSLATSGAIPMATVSDILAGKGMHLITVSTQASVYHAAILMNEQKIGSLLVLEEGRLVGILTERDILMRVVADRLDADAT